MRTLLALLATAAVASAQAPAFRAAPKATQNVVEFELDGSTDVEVAVLDSKGVVVRHLAAGVLGGKYPPPPPLKPGLAQRLEWDGKTDRGQPAANGPFQFRVRAGTSVQFGKLIGSSPYTGSVGGVPFLAPLNGLVIGPNGNLFVMMMSAVGSHGNSGMWPWHLREFDPQGNYKKTWMPYPPSTPAEKASGFRLLETPGQFTPTLATSLYPVFSVLGSQVLPRLHDGRMVLINTPARKLHFLKLDGSNELKDAVMWPASAKLNCPSWLDIQVAFSPDGKTAYYSNVAGVVYDGKTPDQIDAKWPQGRIYRHDLTQADSTPEPFFDLTLPKWEETKYWQPSAWDKKSAAAGIDVDAKGNVLVCDLVNQQVVEISPEGKKLSATPVPWPDRVLVSRKTGDLFVVSRKVSRGSLPPATLSKIVGRGENAKTAATLALPGTLGGGFTIDESTAAPTLWLAGTGKSGSGKGSDVGALWRVEDRGDSLAVVNDAILNKDPSAISFVGYMDVDREAEFVYVTNSGSRVWRFNGETGEGGELPIHAVDVAIGPNGDIYAWGTGGYQGPVVRYRRDLTKLPIPEIGKNEYGHLYGRAGRGLSVCGIDVDSLGKVYATYGSNDCHVRVYDDKGQLVDFPRKQTEATKGGKQVPAAITGVIGYGGSLRVDGTGNIYLLQQGLPKDYPVPAGFEKAEGYRQSVGTIYKFPPTGGEVKTKNSAVQEVVGSIASYPNCGPISRWNAVGACACTKPRFDVDDYGRLYIPNALTFSVSMRDNADNEIVQFGGYGNFDCQGPKSTEPAPAIPLGWPVTAGASDRFIYVGDALNHRVVRVDRKYALEVAVPLTK